MLELFAACLAFWAWADSQPRQPHLWPRTELILIPYMVIAFLLLRVFR